ncbi:YggS family pyridoxal phosphate-dependent enzyme [soil metagenome]
MLFQDLPARLADVRERIDAARSRGGHGQSVTIVAVTKTYGADAPMAAFAAGVKDVGENKVQEAVVKMQEVTVPLQWHLIGHLQRNKVKQLDGFHLVHSVDSARLADAVASFGVSRRLDVDALLQVNVSGEGSKGGFGPAELEGESARLVGQSGLRVHGVMTMAPFDASEAVLRRVFSGAREAAKVLRNAGHPATELSMGMSGDYEVAVEEGATLVRLGTVLFGARAG